MQLKMARAAVAIALTGCVGAPAPGAPRTAATRSEVPIALDSGIARAATTVSVRGNATSEAHYCGGGAAATEEMMRAAKRSTPLPNAIFKANPGREIDLSAETTTFTTGADASFTVTLPKGPWCFYRASRTHYVPIAPADAELRASRSDGYFDPDCLEREKFRCDDVIEVGVETVEVNIRISEGCPEEWNQPCWIGPLPP